MSSPPQSSGSAATRHPSSRASSFPSMAVSARSAASDLAEGSPASDRQSSYRWTIVALLFAATTINYLDRQVLGILAPTLQRDLSWSETDYGDIVSWFSFVYALGFLGVGRVID